MSVWDGRTAYAGTARREFLRYQKIVREYEAKHAAGQLKPQESKSEHVPPAARVRPSIERETKAALAEVDERMARLPDQPKASSVMGVAVADLRITDPALTAAQATFRTAGNRLAPVVRALQGLDTDVVGADPLAGKLQDAQGLLGAELGIVGQALTQLADHVSEINAVFTQTDQQLGQAAGAAR
jgi:hypothetical protein